jgi:DNA-binding CsgD family transcriptional regulator
MSINISAIRAEHPCIRFADEFSAYCQGALSHLGITYFSHVNVDEEQSTWSMCSDPDFYIRFLKADLTKQTLLQQKTEEGEQYILSDILLKSEKLQKIQGLVHDSGYGHQFTIIQTHNGQRDYYHFATQLGNEQMNNKYLWYLPELKRFMNDYKDRMLGAKYDTVQKELGMIIPPPVDNFLSFSALGEGSDMRRIPYRNTYITKREFECLHWLAENKTSREVADILSITPRTVKAHTDNIKEKTGFQSRFHLGMLYHELKQYTNSILQIAE